MTKQKAISILSKLSNKDLEYKLEEFGYNLSINSLTRSRIESEIIAELDYYCDAQIEELLQKLT